MINDYNLSLLGFIHFQYFPEMLIHYSFSLSSFLIRLVLSPPLLQDLPEDPVCISYLVWIRLFLPGDLDIILLCNEPGSLLFPGFYCHFSSLRGVM